MEEIIQKARTDILQANTESAKRNLFCGMLGELFDDKVSKEIINDMSKGAEKRIDLTDGLSKRQHGYQDTQYRNIIIEFKNNLVGSEVESAKDQLHGYVWGNILKSKRTDYVLIATDCIHWYVYYPKVQADINTGTQKKDISLTLGQKFTLDEKNSEDYYYFLDRYLFAQIEKGSHPGKHTKGFRCPFGYLQRMP